MANVGKLVANGKGYRGRVAMLAFAADIALDENPRHDARDENSPRFVVTARAGNDHVEIGAAWQRTIQRGHEAGKPMLSITIDDPSLAAPLNLAAFQRDGGSYDVTWSRPRPDARDFKPDPGEGGMIPKIEVETYFGAVQSRILLHIPSGASEVWFTVAEAEALMRALKVAVTAARARPNEPDAAGG